MEPIVDGLEQEYQEEITFFSINAAADGKDTFRYYNLPGHPGYVLLNPSGDVLWSGFGELTIEKINGELKSHVFQIEWDISVDSMILEKKNILAAVLKLRNS